MAEPNTENRDRTALVPEGHYRAGPGVLPSWLAGRLVLLEHADQGGWWFLVALVRMRGRITAEMVTRWDAASIGGDDD